MCKQHFTVVWTTAYTVTTVQQLWAHHMFCMRNIHLSSELSHKCSAVKSATFPFELSSCRSIKWTYLCKVLSIKQYLGKCGHSLRFHHWLKWFLRGKKTETFCPIIPYSSNIQKKVLKINQQMMIFSFRSFCELLVKSRRTVFSNRDMIL